jgi:2-dehydro-3-deoxyphosphogluconate aldolase/(4S)-4-hydroxy-2-oxoglutarate aldolase
MTSLSQILESKIVAIIRGANPRDVLKIAMALNRGGVKILEITFNSQNALGVIEELVNEMGSQMLVGAGTVLNAETAKTAIEAGARFIISPNTNIETIQMTKRYDAVSIPGAYTATEVVNAYNSGGDIIKVFPATNAEYIKVLRGPLSHIPMMPTGGITLENISEFQKAGAVAFGIGTSLVDTKREITKEYLEQITENAHKFVQVVS